MVELEIKRRIQPCRLDLLRADGRSLQSEKWRNVHLWQRILKKLPEMKTWFPVHRLVSSSRFVWYHPRSDRSENKGTLYSKPKSIPPFWPPSTNYKCGVRVPVDVIVCGLRPLARHSWARSVQIVPWSRSRPITVVDTVFVSFLNFYFHHFYVVHLQKKRIIESNEFS